ncbi:MAG: Gfo/Idh/MocA family oxidoreductase [Planctomycetia bacterium]|nr:Gfo/Idh/MocA family oxidoreductase [Planctomycetia bacterium]
MAKIGVGLVGSQFITTQHYEALQHVADADVLAVASPTIEHVRSFAEKRRIPRWFVDYRQLYELPEIQLVVLGLPNDLHCEAVVAAAAARKHVVLEKPMAMNLAECDRMIEACRAAGVKLMYAEELCFAPKYVRLKQLVDSAALGKPHLVKQMEKHSGPHAAWFWDADRSGGGVTLDMGCHAVEFFRWLQSGPDCRNRPRATSVYAQMGTYVHGDKTRADDEALIIVEFDNGCVGLAEESWAKLGGMDDRAEVYGSAGVAFADLLRGNSIHTYSERGYDYAVEKASQTTGWSFTIYEENWNYGFPQEMAHFVECVRDDKQPIVTGEDGRATLEIIMAAYASAGAGKKIPLPFKTAAKRPIDLWRG